MSVAASNQLNVMNIGETPTFQCVRDGRQLKSIIDITLASENISDKVTDWSVNVEACQASDHNAIEFTIGTGVLNRPSNRSSTYYFNSKTADWTKFNESLSSTMEASGLLTTDFNSLDSAQVDDIVVRTTETIRSACFASMKVRGSGRDINPWWTPELEDLKQDCVRLHHRLNSLSSRDAVTDDDVSNFRDARVLYAKAIRRESASNFRSFCTKQGKEDVWSLTNRLIKDAPKQQPPSTLKTAFGFTSTSEETAGALLSHFYPDDTPDVGSRQEALRTSQDVLSAADDEPPFTSA